MTRHLMAAAVVVMGAGVAAAHLMFGEAGREPTEKLMT